jgi:hypothetical protein
MSRTSRFMSEPDDAPDCPVCGEDELDPRGAYFRDAYWCHGCQSHQYFEDREGNEPGGDS